MSTALGLRACSGAMKSGVPMSVPDGLPAEGAITYAGSIADAVAGADPGGATTSLPDCPPSPTATAIFGGTR